MQLYMIKNYDDFMENPFFYVPHLEELYTLRCSRKGAIQLTDPHRDAPLPAGIKDHSKERRSMRHNNGRIAMLNKVIGHAKGDYNFEQDATGLTRTKIAHPVLSTSKAMRAAEVAKNDRAGIAKPESLKK